LTSRNRPVELLTESWRHETTNQLKSMREQFIEKNFGAEARAMISTINGILTEYVAAGYDLSLRQLYYQLVSRNIVENTERNYKNVGNVVSDARMAGLIDWDIIKDRGRETIQNPHWNSPADIMHTAATQFRVDRWENQNCYVEVMVEKQALEGVLIPVCSEWDVPFTANKGYSSSSAMYEASKRYLKRAEQDKELFVLYLGDHDPSGIDMTRDVDDRLEKFIKVSLGRAENEDAGLTVKRLALNMNQVEEMRPPENPAKITDSRAAAYIERFGGSSWELDAIEPRRLAALVYDAIKSIVDMKRWKETGKIQEAGRNYIATMAKNYKPRAA
jgi:hypothetical protein